MLSPPELKAFLPSKLFLNLIMCPLYEHVVQARSPEEVGCGGGQAKRVDGPPTVRSVSLQVKVAPFMA